MGTTARNAAIAFLLVGFGIGFAAIYPWMRQRAPEIARPLPVLSSPTRAPALPPPPPLDAAQVAELEQMVRNDPTDYLAMTELGNIYFEQENYSKAVDWYERVLDVRPDQISVRTDMGGALFYAGRIDESIEQFHIALESDPTDPQALFNLGVALLEGKQDRQGALEAWEKLVAENPDFPAVDIVREQIQLLREQQ